MPPEQEAAHSEDIDDEQEEVPVAAESEGVQESELPLPSEDSDEAEQLAARSVEASLISLGFVAFDSTSADNAASGVMVAEDRRRHFRRDAYVGIRDEDQDIEFLGRVVEGPFHAPHEISPGSAITRTTILHPERTRFRPTYYAFGTVEVLGEIRHGERVVPTPTRPRPYSEVYMFPADRLAAMLGIEGGFFLGHLMGYKQVEVRANAEAKNFLPRNVGVFGTVGSGKSNSVQVLMEEALQSDWAVVVIDVEGEYVRMNEPTDDPAMSSLLDEQFGRDPSGVEDFRVYVPSAGRSEAADAAQFKVPLAGLEPTVIADILEFSEPQVRMFGTVIAAAARQAQRSGSRRGVLAGGARSRERSFTLQDLIDGLDEDANFPLLGGNVRSHEQSTAAVLRSKLIGLGLSGMLDWGATSRVPELPIDELLVAGRLSVLDVSETDDRSRNIAIAYTLGALFDRVIEAGVGENLSSGLPRPKVLAVVEEVHTFVSRATAAKMRSVIDQLQIISRRGRKRWMALALVSQQPSHVPDELFELTNTRFIHQLKSTANLAPVRQTTGGVHDALWTTVPALGPGQCLLTGAVFRNPLFVSMRPAMSRRLLVT